MRAYQHTAAAILLVIAVVQLATCAHNLDEEYHFSAILDDGYTLHWNFDQEEQTIDFAVNVSTTGWVGFGLSPNGQMPQSDVVIGWVDNNGNTQFDDRFAIDRYLPPVDESQDWFLVSGEEENGYTILEFTRSLTSCDQNDLDIKADTARVIWAYHSLDPVNLKSLGSLRHERMGSISLNLIGGSSEERIEQNSDFFIINNENLEIPSKDTTYWCSVYSLPEEVRHQERYIYKFGPVIPASSAQYVHHIVVYVCSYLNHTHVGASAECDNAHIDISLCRFGGTIIAAWAVGGEEFIYPEDIAYPIGGEGNAQYVILEMHYDNPAEISGVTDSSGLKFTYTSEPQRHRAGILTVGYTSNNRLIIPPGRDNHIINSLCPGRCTQEFFPPEGITVFGNMLHTHLAGHGLVVRQFRQNEECGVLEELEPIDENRRYDFNYQQVTHLPRKVKISPGDTVQVQCFYRTAAAKNVTLGGESTREEMCFTFLMYYPEVDLSYCLSHASLSSYSTFIEHHIHPFQHESFYNSLSSYDSKTAQIILDQVEWTDDASTMIEQVLATNSSNFCINAKDPTESLVFDSPIPSAECLYEAPDSCTTAQSSSCCEKLQMLSGAITQGGLHHLMTLIASCIFVLSMH